MPSLFQNPKNMKLIEYGPHAEDGFSISYIRAFFQKLWARI